MVSLQASSVEADFQENKIKLKNKTKPKIQRAEM